MYKPNPLPEAWVGTVPVTEARVPVLLPVYTICFVLLLISPGYQSNLTEAPGQSIQTQWFFQKSECFLIHGIDHFFIFSLSGH